MITNMRGGLPLGAGRPYKGAMDVSLRQHRQERYWRRAIAFAILALSWLIAPTAFAEPRAKTKYLEVSLVSDKAEIAPGETFHIAFVERIRPGWHTYWRNPGDSGEPTRITWMLPKGYTAGDIIWPAPERIPVGPLANYGFKGEVRLPTPITVPKSAKPGEHATIKASATWLVCQEVCVPESASVDLELPVAAQSVTDPEGAAMIKAALAASPKPSEWPTNFYVADGLLTIGSPDLAQAAAAGNLRAPYFFPFDQGMVTPASAQPSQSGADGITLALPLTPAFRPSGGSIQGVLAYETRGQYSWERQAVEIGATPNTLSGAPAPLSMRGKPIVERQEIAIEEDDGGFPLALVLAFAGGLILNLMPCVFPILSIKALSLANSAHGETKAMRRDGLAFLAGVLATFSVLGGLLIALKAGGAAIGWGFQLQSPLIVGGLALLFFALALNLLGAFSIGGKFQNVGGSLADKGGALGAFFTGALAVIVATPCTAPFMGAALGYGLTAPAWESMSIFLMLGLGLATPFTAFTFAPGLARKLPKPGPWMVSFKEFLAFPMIAAAVWLIWVLAQQAGSNGVLCALSAMAAFGAITWAVRLLKGKARIILCAIGAVTMVVCLAALSVEENDDATPAWDVKDAAAGAPWSRAAVEQARAEGKTVFVNFTAAWCITCKVNETVALSSPKVQAALSAPKLAYFIGDWTKHDAAIAAELAAHQRAGVPLYLVYKPGEPEPTVLPQILTEKIVLDALKRE